MLKGELNELLKKGDEQIKEIKDQQIILITNYIKEKYQLERGDIIIYNGFKVVIVGFDYEGNASHIKLRYRRIKYTGALDNITYKAELKHGYERDGKFKNL